MIPILYDKSETAFTSNGLGRLADCLTCTVTEERNGIYECQFTYPITGEMYSEIQEGRIIGVIHDDVHDIQPFDIYSRSAPLNGVVTFYAHHISYRLGNIILKPVSASSCAAAFSLIPNQTYTECPFTFWTDKSVSATWKNEVPNAVKAILGGQQGSILDVYGKGEYEWDKWTVKLYVNRGVDQGVSIRYGVNLTDLKHDIDMSGAYSAVVPYWKSTEDDTVVMLDEGYVKVPLPQLVSWTTNNDEEITDNNDNVICFNAEASAAIIRTATMALSEAFEEQPTQEQLRAEALRRLTNSEAWMPSENITVKFVDLAHTEEYKDVAALQRVRLCDRVSVYCGPMGVSAVSMQVIRVKFNVLTERYDEIELGKAKTSFAQSITEKVEEATKDLPTVSAMQRAIDNATSQISGANGGHVRFVYDANGDPQEILIMDTEDIETAVNVWRWNSGGLGFSSNGYAGPYETAITQDGQIVANFITAGEIDATLITVGNLIADIIKGGTLTLGGSNNTNGTLVVKDAQGNVVGTWNNSGISIDKGDINIGNNFIVDNSGNVTAKSLTANDYLRVDGNSNSYFNIPLVHDGYFRISDSGLTINTYALSPVPMHSIGGLDNVIVSFGGNKGTSLFESVYPIMLNSTKYPDAFLGIAPGQLYIESENYQSYVFRIRVMPDGIWMESKGSSGTFETNSSYRTNCTVGGQLAVKGKMTVDGTKSRSVTTDQYSDRLLYCYETPTPMFGDIGEGVISEDGLCYVWLDPVFAQTITTDQYQVFLQRYGEGECYVKERRGGCFIVAGTPGLSFGWEVKAKQRDYDQLRLEKNEELFTVPAPTYGADAAQHIDEIRKEREAA